jgi:hypothetical protein
MTPFHRAVHRRDQRGFALSSPLALLSVVAVAAAGVAFVATGSEPDAAPVATSATSTPTAAPSTAPAPVVKARPVRKKPVVRRGGTFVEVFNNSGISGLAGSTAARASGAGWQVVGSDNWYGTIPASTVYYPARLEAQAVLLGKDLGIARVKPTIAPMRGDRLTVILTRDYR